ncbi:iron complex transport system substrate-binding protein [Arenibacter nanhaiticus]|uniref:Iron complex transport system substrate-binding protein n=1 Tax=Arenibacter nanhaiticus TaxID=558155 RepID=A0A1M6EDZ3_9FLAO|nr:ABC transporter substrate-binding protein [Arenibacter nanhaiticus]SHI83599.1 iron complex transport system substrate-binding protein [Arenibacter nanhaiticus]
MKKLLTIIFLLFFLSCKEEKKQQLPKLNETEKVVIEYAKGFSIAKTSDDITVITINSPWPNAESSYTYALIPKAKQAFISLDASAYDAIIATPIERIIVTSTTHIPALEALGVPDKLVGFPNTNFISSEATRELISKGQVQDLGSNESINTEMVIALQPEVVIGFGIDNKNSAYSTIQRANIPVVYNGDWTEESPLGKSEWIKFFAPFFDKEAKADTIFNTIETSYQEAKELAKKATSKPTVLSGGLYKDVWYLPGGNSWMAQFFKDAQADYLWKETRETGSLSLSWESVFSKAEKADFWISPSMHTTYASMAEASLHYQQFDAFKNKNIHSYTLATGSTGGLLFFELGPSRPDIVLKDFIHIFHPELLPDYLPTFFKPLQ